MNIDKALSIIWIKINKNDLNESKNELKNKYKEIALKIHPDKNKSDPLAVEKFQELQDAYQTIYRYIREVAKSNKKSFEELQDIYSTERNKYEKNINNTKKFSNEEFEMHKVISVYEEGRKDFSPIV